MCKGYDPKAVLIPKSVKTLAASYLDKHQRGAFIRSYVKVLEAEQHQRSNKRSKEA